MPPLAPVPSVLRCVINQAYGGVPVINVLHARQVAGGSWTQADADSYVAALRSAWVNNILAQQTNTLTLGSVVGTDLSSPFGVVATTGGSSPGALAGAALPASIAMCVTWPIPRHYRGGHPRTYLAGMTTGAQLNANSWVGSIITTMLANTANMRTTLNAAVNSTGAVELSCVHRRYNKVVLATPIITKLGVPTVDSRIDSQRRRLGRDR